MSDNFPQGKIFKVVNSVNNKVFIGGTNRSIANVLSAYVRFAEKYPDNPQSEFMQDYLKFGPNKFSTKLIKRVHTTTTKEINIEKKNVISEYTKNKIPLYNTRFTQKEKNKNKKLSSGV